MDAVLWQIYWEVNNKSKETLKLTFKSSESVIYLSYIYTDINSIDLFTQVILIKIERVKDVWKTWQNIEY